MPFLGVIAVTPIDEFERRLESCPVSIVGTVFINPAVAERHQVTEHIETRRPGEILLRLPQKMRLGLVNAWPVSRHEADLSCPAGRWHDGQMQHPGVAMVCRPIL